MKRSKEKVPGFDEIIFENRNKEYGAYVLRNKGRAATAWSTIGGSVIFTALTLILSFSVEKNAHADRKPVIIILQADTTITDRHDVKPPEPEKPKTDISQVKYIPPVIVDKVDSTDRTMVAVVNYDTLSNRPVNQVDILVADPDPIVSIEPDPPVIVEEMPVFPGGQTALMKFINENIVYPGEALANEVEGRVFLRFVVAADGSVKRIQIIKGVDPLLDNEAIRVIGMLPKWKPGRNNGTPAAVWFSVPVYFKINRK